MALPIWLARVPGEVRSHDRLLADRDEDLATWVADEKLRLDRRLDEILDELNPQGLLWSGQRNLLRARAKEARLHLWRDQEREAQRFRAGLEAKEEWAHRLWRTIRGRPFPPLATPLRAEPVLDHWREGESFEGSPVCPVNDPTRRTLDATLEELLGPSAD